jgi:hypothetical protein
MGTSRRKLERVPELARWQRLALLGLERPADLTEHESMDWICDGYPSTLAPVWRQYREQLLPEWRALRGKAKHPMDGDPPELPRPRSRR